MDDVRRPGLETHVRVAEVVRLEMDGEAALGALRAVHAARVALKACGGEAGVIEALEAHERALGIAIGAERARAFLAKG